MGWRELQGWIAALARRRDAEQGLHQTAPDSWAGYENDGWWAQQREKRARERR